VGGRSRRHRSDPGLNTHDLLHSRPLSDDRDVRNRGLLPFACCRSTMCPRPGQGRSCGRTEHKQSGSRSAWPRPPGCRTLSRGCVGAIEAQEPIIEFRLISIIDREGRTATHSGDRTLGDVQCSRGSQHRLLLLKSQRVIAAMIRNGSATEGEHIGDRVLAAMLAGVAAGGEEAPCIQPVCSS
jgi:hypothetical protein